jgi:hypothetical protein
MKRLAAIIACVVVAGCAKPVQFPESRLPAQPIAMRDLPEELTSEEREACQIAARRKDEGWLKHMPSVCRKAETNWLGWTTLRKFVARIWSNLTFNAAG